MQIFDYYLDAFKYRYADFEGRATRSEYWYFTLFNILIILFVLPLFTILFNYEYVLAGIGIYFLVAFIPNIAILVRRLHDTNKSGFWYFIGFVPAGIFVLLFFLCQNSDPYKNQYGSNPKDNNLDYIDDDISRHLVD